MREKEWFWMFSVATTRGKERKGVFNSCIEFQCCRIHSVSLSLSLSLPEQNCTFRLREVSTGVSFSDFPMSSGQMEMCERREGEWKIKGNKWNEAHLTVFSLTHRNMNTLRVFVQSMMHLSKTGHCPVDDH